MVRQAGMESPAVIDELDDLLIEYGRNRSYISIYICVYIYRNIMKYYEILGFPKFPLAMLDCQRVLS